MSIFDREPWEDDLEQAREDGWALRVLDCPRPQCRRQRRCTEAVCPGLSKHPIPARLGEALLPALRRKIKERLEAIRAGPEAEAALHAAWSADSARRRQLAFQRARKKLGLREKKRS